MSKKIIISIAVVLTLILAVSLLAGCNAKLSWDGIGGGDATADVVSQGKFVVKQGNYLYFINGYQGNNTDNTFGAAVQGAIMRAELNADGTIKTVLDSEGEVDAEATYKIVVPVNVYTSDKNVGFAIYGEWIYYATPNTDKDSTGTASTTHLDFMRSKIDGSSPEKLLTIDSRTVEYKLYNGTLVYYNSTDATLIKFDLTLGSEKKIEKSETVIATEVVDVVFSYEETTTANQGEQMSDFIIYSKSRPTEESAFYYDIMAVKYDGSKTTTLVTGTTYLPAGSTTADLITNTSKVFRLAFIASTLDEGDLVLYYTKAIYLNQTSTTRGLFYNKISLVNGTPTFSVANEKKLSESGTNTTITPLGYDEGVLLTVSSNVFLVKGYTDGTADPNSYDTTKAVVGASLAPTILFVEGSDLYYLSSNTIYKISVTDESAVATLLIASVAVSTTWITCDIVGDYIFFFDTDNNSYVTAYNRTINDTETDGCFTKLGYAPATEEDTAA